MRRELFWLAMLGLILGPTGCGNSQPGTTGQSEHARIQTLSSMYAGYVARHKNQAPADENAFRTYLNTKTSELQKAGLTIDDVFASPRTGVPLQWVYNQRPVTGRAGMSYIGYETTSTDNKRLVIAKAGMYEIMDDADFRRYFPKAP